MPDLPNVVIKPKFDGRGPTNSLTDMSSSAEKEVLQL